MKRRWIFGALAMWAACQGALFHFTLEQTAETTVEEGTIVENLLVDFGFEDFIALDITSSEEFENQGVEPGDVSTVTLKSFGLAATAPEDADLSWLDEVEVYVESDGLDRILIASASDFPAGQAAVDFDLEDVDIADYVVSEAMTVSTEVTGNRPEDDTTVAATFELRIGVTTQGACNFIKGSGDDDA